MRKIYTPSELVGKRFGKITVIAAVKMPMRRVWECKCDCGVTRTFKTGDLLEAKSCGCVKLSRLGLSNTAVGSTWRNMLNRCYKTSVPNFKDYGGRGIRVCEFIRIGPKSILDLIGERPDGHSIDRMEVNGMYSCGKCSECRENGWVLNIKWSTRLEQNRNQRDLRYLTFNGEKKCLSEWAIESGVKRTTIHARIRYGWKQESLLDPLVEKYLSKNRRKP